MAKRFKVLECWVVNTDSTLAETVTDLFRNGVNEERNAELVKDEIYSRPANCDGLVVVKVNQLIWDAVSASAHICDRKMQNIETSVVKTTSF